MKPVDIKPSMYFDCNTLIKKIIRKVLNLKFAIVSEYQNIKIFLLKGYVLSWSEEVSVIANVKNTVPWTYFVRDFNDEEIVGTFYEIELQKKKNKLKRV